MKKIVTCILTILGLTSAYGQKNYEDADVKSFYDLMQRPNVFCLMCVQRRSLLKDTLREP